METKEKRNITISEIESLSEKEAQSMAEDVEIVKEHKVYFVDLEGYFKYSALVYFNSKQIKYANEYELHHPGKTHDELKKYYLESLNKKLYTESELSAPVESYNDYELKSYFLRNYYPLRYEYISAFQIFNNEAEEMLFKNEVKKLHYNPVCFGYFKDEEVVKKMIKLNISLEKERAKADKSYDYMKKAFYKELFNIEYIINWQADFDLFSCFGSVVYEENKDASDYMKELGFTEEQRKAFYDARNEYYKEARC